MNDSCAGTQRTIRTMSLGTLWRLLRYPFVLLSLALIPRLMGDADYGRYAYFVSLFVILDVCTDLGFLHIFGRFVPESESDGDHACSIGLLHGVLGFGVFLSVLMAAGLLCVYVFRPWADVSLHWVALMGLMLILTRVEGTFFTFLYGLNEIGKFSAKEMVRSACTLIFVIVGYHFFGILGALWALVIQELVLCAWGAYWTRHFLFRRGRRLGVSGLRPYIVFGISFYVPAFLLGLLQRSGNVLVHMLTGSAREVAYYDIANQFLLLTAMFLGLVLQTLLPALARLQMSDDTETIARWQRTVITYCGVLGFLSVNALMWLGEPVILMWLGEDFRPVVRNAQAISPAIIPTLIAYAGMNYALLEKKAGMYLVGVGLGWLTMGITGLFWIPRFGSIGAAWSTTAGYTALGAVFLVHYRAHFKQVLRDFIWVVGVAFCFAPLYMREVVGPAVVFWFLGTSLFYVAILVGLRVIRWSDAVKVIAAFRKDRA